jgi:hypothetical protein
MHEKCLQRADAPPLVLLQTSSCKHLPTPSRQLHFTQQIQRDCLPLHGMECVLHTAIRPCSSALTDMTPSRQSISIQTHPRRTHQQSRSSSLQERLLSTCAGEPVVRTRYTVVDWTEMLLSGLHLACLSNAYWKLTCLLALPIEPISKHRHTA